jgi:hypothetical protein
VTTQQAVSYGTLGTHAVLSMKVVGTQLAIPYSDPNGGSFPCAAFLNTDGTLEVVDGGIRCEHLFGSEFFNSKRYLSGAHSCAARAVWRDDSGAWADPSLNPNSYFGGCVGGFARAYALFAYNGALYVSVDAGPILKSTTGALGSWSQVATGPGTMREPVPYNGFIYYGSVPSNAGAGFATGGLFRFNGTSQTTIVSSGIWDHTIGSDGELYYLNSAGQIKNAAGTTVETAPANARSIAYVGGVWYVGTNGGHLWRKG